MTLEELNTLRDTYSFPSRVQIRLPDEGETITFTHPSEVAFYEAAFPAGLRFPLHPTIRLILQFYNICLAQLVPNAWRSIACSMALWRVYKYTISLSEFRNLFSLNSNPKPDQSWLYFKARNKKVLLGGYPSNVKGWKSKFFFVSGDEWEIPNGTSRECAPRVPRTWGIPGRSLFSFYPVFILLNARALRTAGDNLPSRDALSSSSDVGSIRIELRRLLPHIPDLTLLRWSGGKVLDPILDRFLNALSSNPSSESCSDSSLPVELESDAMSKRVSFKKIGEKLRKTASSSLGTPVPAKEVMIGEKRAGESITSLPSKKEKANDGSKEKGVDSGPEGKKKATSSSKALATPTAASSRPGEGTSANHGTIPSPTPSILGSPSVTEREAGEQASLQEGRVASMETEVARLQKFAADLEQQLAESRAREQQASDELAKMKSDRDSLADKLERSGMLVNELREALDKAKEAAVEEFKSSSEFMVAVEDSASKYFGEGFDFYKVQFRRIIPTSLSILKAPWSIKIYWRSKTRLLRRKKRKNWARTRG
ncbi:hypothetical protein Acr_06g0008560 [Actinidia rufa]|uniref:Transposase (putative) gypsy type domain-containing protein n=1 Tax=Actinidia rufa TaxID=165716 RepID=A0A7J0ERT4_9ERIC|nr:hypothetical protein Acr_06g0008560 [Actinidia rufa]